MITFHHLDGLLTLEEKTKQMLEEIKGIEERSELNDEDLDCLKLYKLMIQLYSILPFNITHQNLPSIQDLLQEILDLWVQKEDIFLMNAIQILMIKVQDNLSNFKPKITELMTKRINKEMEYFFHLIKFIGNILNQKKKLFIVYLSSS